MNAIALSFIKARESCRLDAYLDSGGVPTIGWGATGPNIRLGTKWTQDEADLDLANRVGICVRAVQELTLSVRLSEQQEAALASFAYNCGRGALAVSHLLAFTRARNWMAAAKAFLIADHVHGVEIQGLLKRRMEEAALYLEGSP